MKSKLRAAYELACSGYSPDRVVADPNLDDIFLKECGGLGLVGPASALNRSLLNLRKQGGLRGLKSKRTTFLEEDEYRFAAEIAVRFLERRDALSLDDIICDPVVAAEFDRLADRIAPGYRPVEYRWAALNLRKGRKLKPEVASRLIAAEMVEILAVANVDFSRLPTRQGLYIFLTKHSTLYVGEAENLQNRIRKHLDHSDNKGFARWLWEDGPSDILVEVHVLPSDTSTRVRRALEMELIWSRDPLFNIRR